jgi:hypothetical protein
MVQSFKKEIQDDYHLFYMHMVYKTFIKIYLNDIKYNVLGYLGTSHILEYLKR